ncbi:quinolinate synthase NadA [bacterium]|nr:quinolinate synthase NadA [bacterium]
MSNENIKNQIEKIKKKKNAVILAHSYQNLEIDEVADFTGDSLQLSRLAASTNSDIIVFCGVYFMAETAKILSPKKKVLLPNVKSGCRMADMIDLNQIKTFKKAHPNIPVVCYVNSTAEVKSESDVCVTSSNALKVVKNLGAKEILFVPDTYLGTWVSEKLPDVNIITYPGYCPTHLNIMAEDIINKKEENPNAIVLAHPECHKSVVELADFAGSTTQIMDYVFKSNEKEFIIATEKGVVDRLSRDLPQKKFILASKRAVCPNMKRHYLEDVLTCLVEEKYEIDVDENLAKKALMSIERMFELCK